ncbi:MAG: pyridoxal-phosphate dependent enzyme [Luteolibacter sp.]|jgi:threonine synthase|nr:pyridoxal-phosphate dependent enzyme [Luteolibacter sp.]
MTEVVYDLENVRFRDSGNPYMRFQDLLPVRDPALLPQDAVYTEIIHAEKLGAFLEMPNLYLKNEGRHPTGTTKDHMAAVSLPFMYECGVRAFCTSSTGNSSTSYARAVARFPGMRMFVFTAENFRARVNYRDLPQVTHYVMKDASFVNAFDYSGEFAKLNDFVSERGFFNPGRREGLKITFLEAAEQIPRPIDWYVQGISSAMGVHGVYKGAKELHAMGKIPRLPSLLCVQQESCSPMVHAWEEGFGQIQPHHIIHRPAGIAEAILRGDPSRVYPIIRGIVNESGGRFARAAEKEIRAARKLLLELEGVNACFSSSTALAGLIKLAHSGDFPLKDTVMINLTGSDRQADPDQLQHQDLRWLVKSGKGWAAEDPSLDGGMKHSASFF